MELIELKVETRQNKGKGAARTLRRNNAFPAVIYGAKTEPLMVSVVTSDFKKVIRENGSSGLFLNLFVDGDDQKPRAVVLKDTQMDPFKLQYLHVDFHEIDMDKTVIIDIPVEVTGKSKGIEAGGVLQIIRRKLEVACKPADAPEFITIDISDMEIGDVLHVEDIDMGENIELLHDVNFTVLTIAAPTTDGRSEEEEEEDYDEVAAPVAKKAEPKSE